MLPPTQCSSVSPRKTLSPISILHISIPILTLFLSDACNTQGSWGAGVAFTFKKRYPRAYSIYHNHCKSRPSEIPRLTGTCLLISPQQGDSKKHWIACLFTSPRYGRQKAAADKILEYTAAALEDLKTQVEVLRESKKEVGELWAVRINSGKFGVPWERSKSVLEATGMSVKVVRPPSGENQESGGKMGQNGGRGIKRPTDAAQTSPRKASSNQAKPSLRNGDGAQARQASIEKWII